MLSPRPLLIAIACWPLLAGAGDSDAYFELTDGSVITGELLGLDTNGYRVRSATLGELTIDDSKVRLMRRGGPLAPADGVAGNPSAAPAPTAALDPRALAAMQQRLTGDAAIMDMIRQLQNDTELTGALTDPALLQAITSGDLAAMRDDPRLQKLMEHPAIRAIIERVGVQ